MDTFINQLLKRLFDIIISIVLIVFTAPVMGFIIAGVELSLPGQILFKQKRAGLNRKQFAMYKFRSMRVSNHVKPGITGWDQVNGWGGNTSIEERNAH